MRLSDFLDTEPKNTYYDSNGNPMKIKPRKQLNDILKHNTIAYPKDSFFKMLKEYNG
jgi:hypothetical protein